MPISWLVVEGKSRTSARVSLTYLMGTVACQFSLECAAITRIGRPADVTCNHRKAGQSWDRNMANAVARTGKKKYQDGRTSRMYAGRAGDGDENPSFKYVDVFKPHNWQFAPLNSKAPIMLLTGSAGGGKALALDTEIPTITGFKPMGDVRVGDILFDRFGEPTCVVAVTDIMVNRPCHRIYFSSGESVIADAEHLWIVRDYKRDRNFLASTEYMANSLHVFQSKRTNYSVDVVTAVDYQSKEVPIDPYVLGMLLGDGYFRDLSITTADQEIVELIDDRLDSYYLKHTGGLHYAIRPKEGYRPFRQVITPARVYKHTLADRYVAMGKNFDGNETYLGIYPTKDGAEIAADAYTNDFGPNVRGDGIRHELIELGLNGTRSLTKFVPDIYKYNDYGTRLWLLRGLMDADGYIDPGRGRAEFTSISKRLANDVHEMLCSLGVKAHISKKNMTFNGEPYVTWRVQFTSDLPVFAINRKAKYVLHPDDLRETQRRRYITDIEQIESVPVKCIEVDNEDGSFLITRSYIPTHNSRLAAEKIHAFLLAYPGATALVVRKTRTSMYNSTIAFLKKQVMRTYLRNGIVVQNSTEHRFDYQNGSMLVYGGLSDDRQREAIRSIGQMGGIDICWMEEAHEFEEADFNEILSRMRGSAAPWRQVILSTNPDAPTHWIYQKLLLNDNDPEIDIYFSSEKDNPNNPPDYSDKLNRLTGVERDRLRDGLWTEAGGIVFDQWSDKPDNKDSNVTTEAEFEAGGGPVFWWVDDGYSGEVDGDSGMFKARSHPRCFLFVQLKQDGRLAIFDESYEVQMLAPDHIVEVLARSRARGYGRPAHVVYDRAAASLGRFLQEELGKEWNMPASKVRYNTVPVAEGNKEVNTRLAADKNERRQIIVHPRCKFLRLEMVSYKKDPRTGRVIKDFDHGPDAIRIGIWDFIYGKTPEVDVSTQITVDLQGDLNYQLEDGMRVYDDGNVSIAAII